MALGQDFTFALLIAAIVLMMVGAVSAWVAGSGMKRVIGVAIAFGGALVALAAIGAPAAMLLAGAAMVFVNIAIGAALLVRLQEAYGSVELADIDAADAQSDAQEPPR